MLIEGLLESKMLITVACEGKSAAVTVVPAAIEQVMVRNSPEAKPVTEIVPGVSVLVVESNEETASEPETVVATDPEASFPDNTLGVTPAGRTIEIVTAPRSVPDGTFAVLTLSIAFVGAVVGGVVPPPLSPPTPPPQADISNVRLILNSIIRNLFIMLENLAHLSDGLNYHTAPKN
jgi:hypothetical protein